MEGEEAAMRSDRGHLGHVHEQLRRVEDWALALEGSLGWDVDVWLERLVRTARLALQRPGLDRDPVALARLGRILHVEVPEVLALAQDPVEPDAVRRRHAVAARLGELQHELAMLGRDAAA